MARKFVTLAWVLVVAVAGFYAWYVFQWRPAGPAAGVAPTATPSPRLPVLRDEAPVRGLTALVRSGRPVEEKQFLLETIGGGVALLDYDLDGDLDAFLANGCSFQDLDMGTAPGDFLYRNDGHGRFQEVAKQAGITTAGWGQGVAVADYDNDGDPDLYVTCYGPNVLYRNNGDGTFTDVTEEAGVGDPAWSVGAVFFDADADGRLDLYVSNYFHFDLTHPYPVGEKDCQYQGHTVFCGPQGFDPQAGTFYRNLGGGRFQEATSEAGLAPEHVWYGLGVLALDHDLDGDVDLFVANDTKPNNLFINDGTGHFQERGMALGVGVDAEGEPGANMGVGAADFDGDGRTELVVTDFAKEYNRFFVPAGAGYADLSRTRDPSGASWNYVGWGVACPDLDADGHTDLLIANGHVYPAAGSFAGGEIPYEQAPLVYRNVGDGSMEVVTGDVGLASQGVASCRGVAMGDVDEDGDEDFLVGALDSSPLLLMAEGPPAGWVGLRLQGGQSNRDAVGARVILHLKGGSLVKERQGGGSFASAGDPRLLFRFPAAQAVQSLEVHWPSGRKERFDTVQIFQYQDLLEGTGRLLLGGQ